MKIHGPGAQLPFLKLFDTTRPRRLSHETWYFRDDITGEEQGVPLNLRMFFPQEIDVLLHYNGFQIEDKYGGYEEAPFGDSSRKQIIVCSLAALRFDACCA